jgi:hypothetical protein
MVSGWLEVVVVPQGLYARYSYIRDMYDRKKERVPISVRRTGDVDRASGREERSSHQRKK